MYTPSRTSNHKCQYQNQANNAYFVAFVNGVGTEFEADLMLACRDVERAQHVVGTENLDRLSIDVSLPAVRVVDFREYGRFYLT